MILMITRTVATPRPIVVDRTILSRCCNGIWNTRQSVARSFTTHRSSTALDTDAAAKTTAAKRLAKMEFRPITPNTVLFPWRHETKPLPRLIPGTEEHEHDPHKLLSRIQLHHDMETFEELFAAHQVLGVPLTELAMTDEWRQDLADSVSWAFRQSVAGIISNVYKLPSDSLSCDDEYQSIDFSHEASEIFKREPENVDTTTAAANTAKENSSDTADNDPTTPTRTACTDDTEVRHMMDDKLIELYRSACEAGKHRLQVKLKTTPKRATLHSLRIIPGMTRHQDTEWNLKFLGTMLGLRTLSGENLQTMQHMATEQLHRHGHIGYTAICQVRVQCEEEFAVRDMLADKLIQGHGEIRNVEHLVRMENVACWEVKTYGRYFNSAGSRPGSWVLTDIDDLLDGNTIV